MYAAHLRRKWEKSEEGRISQLITATVHFDQQIKATLLTRRSDGTTHFRDWVEAHFATISHRVLSKMIGLQANATYFNVLLYTQRYYIRLLPHAETAAKATAAPAADPIVMNKLSFEALKVI